MKKLAAWVGLLSAIAGAGEWDGSSASIQRSRIQPQAVGTKGMVSADDPEAAAWGAEILRRGGNAIDAAVATAFALAVTRPDYGSLGGGGFLLFCPAKKPNCTAIDYRERAPARATRDMYIKDGKPNTDLSQVGALASGVPGVTAGLLYALEKFGTKKRAEILVKPIALAREGYAWGSTQESTAEEQWDTFNAEAKRVLGCDRVVAGKKTRTHCLTGTRVKQPDLAKVLTEISRRGRDGFYRGWVAKKIVAGIAAAGGILSEKDLAEYAATAREPVTGRFKEFEIVSMPPPSSGGVILLQLFKYMEMASRDGKLKDGWGSARSIHAMTHALSLAFADRTKYFGDADFFKVPITQLLSPGYLTDRWKTFNAKKAALPAEPGEIREPAETTHFSVIDAQGNAVALTTTVNESFGSGFIPPGTGIVMNNEMDDFSIQPGVPNLFGLIGAEANAVQAGKRPLSSMSPTIVRRGDGEVMISIGAAGGPRIISSVFQVLLARLEWNMSLPEAMAAGRIHHQWKPAALRLERGVFAAEVVKALSDIGYTVEISDRSLAVSHAVERFGNGVTWGVGDPRSEGAGVAAR